MRVSWILRVLVMALMVGLLGVMAAPAMAKKKTKVPFSAVVLADSITRAFVLKPGNIMENMVAFIDYGFSMHFPGGATFDGATINGVPHPGSFETLPGILVIQVSEKIKMTSETDGKGSFDGMFTISIDPVTETSLFGTLRGDYEGELFPEVNDPVISPVFGSVKFLGGTGWLEGVTGKGEYEGPQAVSEAYACPNDPLQFLPALNNPILGLPLPPMPPGLNFAHSICLDIDVDGELRLP